MLHLAQSFVIECTDVDEPGTICESYLIIIFQEQFVEGKWV